MTELDFSTQLGVPLALVTSLRHQHLSEQLHFTRHPEIILTDDGLDRLMELLEATAADLSPPEWRVLRVTRIVPNIEQVIAEDAEKKDGGLLTLRVPFYTQGGRTLNHFRVGQTCRARHVEGATWAYLGPRPQSPNDPNAFLSF